MKKISIIMIVLLLFNLQFLTVNAEENVAPVINAPILKLKANSKGEVVVDKTKSIDGNVYILSEVEPEEEFSVMRSTATTFTTLDYRSGFFDNPTTNYTSIGNTALMIDNNLNTSLDGYGMGGSILFDTPITVNSLFAQGFQIDIQFYYQGQLVYSQKPNNTYTTFAPLKIDRIHFVYTDWYSRFLSEIEVFEYDPIEYQSVGNLVVDDITEKEAQVNFNNPKSKFFARNEIYVNGKQVVDYGGGETTHRLKNLTQETKYEVIVRSYYSDGAHIDAITTFTTTKDITPPEEVTNLNVVQTKKSVNISYIKPADLDFSHVKIYRNNKLIADNVSSSTYTDDNETIGDHTYKVVTVDNAGNESKGAMYVFYVSGLEVRNLTADAKEFSKVELSWENPSLNEFEMVTIYRKKENSGIIAKARSLFSVGDGFNPIFETNGTVFRDLSVTANTSYQYKLTTTIDGEETEGVTTRVTTPEVKVVKPEIEQSGDDYLLRWQSPTNGQVKITIDGKEFAVVNAAEQQKIIPNEKLVKDIFGGVRTDLIKIVAIAPDGQESPIISPTAGTGGTGGTGGTDGGTSGIIGDIKKEKVFDAVEVLKIAVGLLGVVGLFVLLGLAFKAAPKLITLIRTSFSIKRG